MKIIVIGGSAAGMFASLILARAGHQVLLLERESLPHVVACTRRVLDDGHSAPRMAQPTREQLLAALAT